MWQRGGCLCPAPAPLPSPAAAAGSPAETPPPPVSHARPVGLVLVYDVLYDIKYWVVSQKERPGEEDASGFELIPWN